MKSIQSNSEITELEMHNTLCLSSVPYDEHVFMCVHLHSWDGCMHRTGTHTWQRHGWNSPVQSVDTFHIFHNTKVTL